MLNCYNNYRYVQKLVYYPPYIYLFQLTRKNLKDTIHQSVPTMCIEIINIPPAIEPNIFAIIYPLG